MIKLSDAQVGALECRDLDGTIIAELWHGDRLSVPSDPEQVERLLDELTEASNGEDADAEQNTNPEMKKFARRAAWSLAAISSKVMKEMTR